jgi:hypothetical protein
MDLPGLPPFPTTQLTPEQRIQLRSALQFLRPFIHRKDAFEHALACYAQVWVHLALERGLDPRRCSGQASQGYQAVLKAFQPAVSRLGLHDQVQAAWWAPQVAPMAATLWRKAKEAQQQAPPPLMALNQALQPLANARPDWLQRMRPR